uniref:WAT1-related protein n=1 Tax=Opuntia streptacantha TaxID=393608 RepID=A0A7C9B2P2_OPUST
MTLYRGPAIRRLWGSPIHLMQGNCQENWLKGAILSVASCLTLIKSCNTLQAFTLKRYPAQLSLATWANFIGAAQSAVFTLLAVNHQPNAWRTESVVMGQTKQ